MEPCLENRVFASWEHFLKKGKTYKKISEPVSPKPDEPAMIMFTSGTTSFPKGVVLSHRGLTHIITIFNLAYLQAMAANKEAQGAIPQAALLSVPLFHATGLYSLLLNGLATGRKSVIMKKWSAKLALEIVEKERITAFSGVPTMVLEMLSHPDRQKRDISSLKYVGSGGSSPPAGVAQDVKVKMNAIPTQGYGLTEMNCLATTIVDQDYLTHPTSCGKPVPGLVIKIWDEKKNEEVPRGQTGRIVIRGVTLMLEYYKDVEATKKAITKDGWFITGDYGYIDNDGFIYINGRSQDLIIRGGENISARTVEEAIYACFENVQECAVFSYPHPTLGEEVGVAIHMKDGFKPISLEEIREKCSARIAGFMLPTGMAIYEHVLPRGATEKTQKKDIQESLKQGKLNWVTLNKSKI